MTLLQQQLDTVVDEDTFCLNYHYGFQCYCLLTLLHWETLLVVATSDTDDVASPFGSEVIGGDFLGLVSLTVVKEK